MKPRDPDENDAAHVSEKTRDEELMTLVELQDFIAQELEISEEGRVRRAFLPLTDGLGLESPKKTEEPARPAPSTKDKLFAGETPSKAPTGAEEWDPLPGDEPEEEAEEAPQTEVASVPTPAPAAAAPVEARRVAVSMTAAEPPPPVPQVSLVRRTLAVVVDQVLVWGLWAVSVVITANVLQGTLFANLNQWLDLLNDATFQRFALLEFAALWVAYLTFTLGVVEMTFGMWVWSIRVAFGASRGSRALSKFLRIVASLVFYVPLLPLGLLMLQFRGRNLLDLFSDTRVYHSPA